MKKIISLSCCILAALLLFFLSCKKDPVMPPAASKTSTTISGIVVDENNTPVSGVSIKGYGQTTTTNKYGGFTLENVEVSEKRCYILSSKNGYFEHAAAAVPVKEGVTDIRIKMMAHTYYSFSASSGGTVNVSGGSSVEFPSEGLIKEDGNAYNGTVKAAIRHIDPETPGFSQLIIGSDLQAMRADGSAASLYSYGMLAVELFTENNEALQLAPGKQATLTMPVPSSMQSSAPPTIPLWFFDNETGLWKEEGTAVKTGDVYIGQVAHFTTWNLDKPENVARVKGKVLGCDLLPVPGVVVRIGQVTAVSGVDGVFEADVLANAQFMIYVDPADNMGLFGNAGKTVGPFAAQQTHDVGTFDVVCTARISGVLVDCDDKPVAGHIFVTWGSNNYSYAYTATGAFVIPVADNTPITIFIQAVNGKYATINMQSPASPLITPLNNVKVCDGSGSFTEDNYFVLNGGPYTNDTTIFQCAGMDSCVASKWTNTYGISLFNKVGDNKSLNIYVKDQPGTHQWTDSTNVNGVKGTNGYFYGMNGSLTLSGAAPNIGDFVSGEFSGVVGMSGSTSPVSINGKFKVIRRY